MFTCLINNWLQPFQFSPLIGSQSCVTYHFMSSVHLDFYTSPLMPSGKLKNHLSNLMLMREAWRPARTYRWGQGVLWTPDFIVSRLLGRTATCVAFPQQWKKKVLRTTQRLPHKAMRSHYRSFSHRLHGTIFIHWFTLLLPKMPFSEFSAPHNFKHGISSHLLGKYSRLLAPIEIVTYIQEIFIHTFILGGKIPRNSDFGVSIFQIIEK